MITSEQKSGEVAPIPVDNSAVLVASIAADQAAKLAADGDYSGANEFLDEKIAAASTTGEKYVLLMAKSNLAKANPAEGIDKSIEYAILADEQNQTYKSAAAVARLYEEAGDKQNAILYYQKTIDRRAAAIAAEQGGVAPEGSTKSNTSPDDSPGSYYQIRIDELSQ